MKLLKVEFTDYSVCLSPGEDLKNLAPDVPCGWAIGTLFEVAARVVDEAKARAKARVPKGLAVVSMNPEIGKVWVSTRVVNPHIARSILAEFRRAVLQEQRRRAELATAFGDPRPPQQEPQEQEPEDLNLPWPPDPEEEARRLRAEVEALLRRRSGGSGS